MKRTATLIAALTTVALAAGCAAAEEEGKSGSGDSGAGAGDTNKCGSRASDDCTPHVAANKSVRVDALNWRIRSASTEQSIGDMTYGLGEEADGVFLVVKLKVTSDRDESADLTDSMIQLEVNGNTYDADNDGTFAATADGQDPFFFESIGPDATESGTVVFDVPRKVLKDKPVIHHIGY